MTYQAPVDDILFALKSAADLDTMLDGGILGDLDEDTLAAIIGEAGNFASDVLAPLNQTGDKAGASLKDGQVVTPDGWKSAYDQFVEAGWPGLPCPEEYGGQGLPSVVSSAVGEIWNAANLSFGICPLLTQGAIHAIETFASDELKQRYLSNMVTGKWTGTMNLTEPQAGSDLSAIKTRAVPQDDGTYRLFGTKIFISYGDHDQTENIIHLVLARLPDAPPGTKGISMFVVPKYMVTEDGSVGERNDVVCAGLEHKLGLHASPTCVMNFGENDGAVGHLVGELNRGLHAMFSMMNRARLGVGVQGVALSEGATQCALAYANDRRQGKDVTSPSHDMVPIIKHPDVRRMLMTMKAMTQAARTMCLLTAAASDRARRAHGEAERNAAAQRLALLTPVAKAFATDTACEVASLGIQVHGGIGFVEEAGAAQYYRDARILPIYEGTNGIQAMDLVARKLPLEGGAVVKAYLGELADIAADISASNQPEFGAMGDRLTTAVGALQEATVWMGGALRSNIEEAFASATPYARLFGITSGAVYLAKGALYAVRKDPDNADRIALARFFAENIATQAPGLASTVTGGAQSVLDMTPDHLTG